MTAQRPTDPTEEGALTFDLALLAARVRAVRDSHLRERAPDQRLAFRKAVALGYGGLFQDLAGCPMPVPAVMSP
ncbi:hypothetical protein ASF28_12555 [Methylobacterium sp. Leaf99]|uniref:hypothetical protein n=1 Tax=Methylobacterium sp. Leaf99 TaxID=1736251 RepID=UPI0006F4155B|nr:hypothetical protein [Methylobacterium sp. Leaf99]KQP07921.1 hypothetical protein ASF28_12555 [Methylobacterium sp. Leaf99]